jgi:hypothetical protein
MDRSPSAPRSSRRARFGAPLHSTVGRARDPSERLSAPSRERPQNGPSGGRGMRPRPPSVPRSAGGCPGELQRPEGTRRASAASGRCSPTAGGPSGTSGSICALEKGDRGASCGVASFLVDQSDPYSDTLTLRGSNGTRRAHVGESHGRGAIASTCSGLRLASRVVPRSSVGKSR